MCVERRPGCLHACVCANVHARECGCVRACTCGSVSGHTCARAVPGITTEAHLSHTSQGALSNSNSSSSSSSSSSSAGHTRAQPEHLWPWCLAAAIAVQVCLIRRLRRGCTARTEHHTGSAPQKGSGGVAQLEQSITRALHLKKAQEGWRSSSRASHGLSTSKRLRRGGAARAEHHTGSAPQKGSGGGAQLEQSIAARRPRPCLPSGCRHCVSFCLSFLSMLAGPLLRPSTARLARPARLAEYRPAFVRRSIAKPMHACASLYAGQQPSWQPLAEPRARARAPPCCCAQDNAIQCQVSFQPSQEKRVYFSVTGVALPSAAELLAGAAPASPLTSPPGGPGPAMEDAPTPTPGTAPAPDPTLLSADAARSPAAMNVMHSSPAIVLGEASATRLNTGADARTHACACVCMYICVCCCTGCVPTYVCMRMGMRLCAYQACILEVRRAKG